MTTLAHQRQVGILFPFQGGSCNITRSLALKWQELLLGSGVNTILTSLSDIHAEIFGVDLSMSVWWDTHFPAELIVVFNLPGMTIGL
jgi:hypothetical protein